MNTAYVIRDKESGKVVSFMDCYIGQVFFDKVAVLASETKEDALADLERVAGYEVFGLEKDSVTKADLEVVTIEWRERSE